MIYTMTLKIIRFTSPKIIDDDREIMDLLKIQFVLKLLKR